MHSTKPATPSPLPRRVFVALIAGTCLGAVYAIGAAVYSDWLPPREWASVVLPLYFAVLLSALALSFVVSGNTLMHHYRTGTIQRASDPVAFWWIVGVQFAIAAILLAIGFAQWIKLYG